MPVNEKCHSNRFERMGDKRTPISSLLVLNGTSSVISWFFISLSSDSMRLRESDCVCDFAVGVRVVPWCPMLFVVIEPPFPFPPSAAPA
jgi:hypothetical protein